MRAIVLVAGLLALLPAERSADACCLGCPCTKYNQDDDPLREQPATGYTHSVRGAVPTWSLPRVTKFLTSGYWSPFPVKLPTLDDPDPPSPYRPASAIQFETAEHAARAGAQLGTARPGKQIFIRRIEKHGSAILVEVNERTWKLAACPKKPGYACLVDPGKLKLDPIASDLVPQGKVGIPGSGSAAP